MRLITIAVAIAAAALVAGCDQHPSKTVKIKGRDGSVTITSNGEHATIKADDGKTTVEINTNSLGGQNLPALRARLSRRPGEGFGGGAVRGRWHVRT